jgi:hypothetical protein
MSTYPQLGRGVDKLRISGSRESGPSHRPPELRSALSKPLSRTDCGVSRVWPLVRRYVARKAGRRDWWVAGPAGMAALHGDLHPANVLVSDGTLSGVIDFGDMFAGDPVWNLAAAWVLLAAGAASRFFDVYALADEATGVDQSVAEVDLCPVVVALLDQVDKPVR